MGPTLMFIIIIYNINGNAHDNSIIAIIFINPQNNKFFIKKKTFQNIYSSHNNIKYINIYISFQLFSLTYDLHSP